MFGSARYCCLLIVPTHKPETLPYVVHLVHFRFQLSPPALTDGWRNVVTAVAADETLQLHYTKFIPGKVLRN